MMPAQAPTSSPAYPMPPYGSNPVQGPDWKVRGGLVKMIGFVIEGVGILVVGFALNYFLQLVNSNGQNTQSIYNNLVNTLEAGVIVAGLGVIVIGIGVYLGSRQK